MFDCPVEGCTRKFRTKDALGVHLYQQHLKAELIKTIESFLEGDGHEP